MRDQCHPSLKFFYIALKNSLEKKEYDLRNLGFQSIAHFMQLLALALNEKELNSYQPIVGSCFNNYFYDFLNGNNLFSKKENVELLIKALYDNRLSPQLFNRDIIFKNLRNSRIKQSIKLIENSISLELKEFYYQILTEINSPTKVAPGIDSPSRSDNVVINFQSYLDTFERDSPYDPNSISAHLGKRLHEEDENKLLAFIVTSVHEVKIQEIASYMKNSSHPYWNRFAKKMKKKAA